MEALGLISGMIMRANGRSYRELGKLSLGIGIIVGFITFLISLFGVAVLSTVSGLSGFILSFITGTIATFIASVIIAFTTAILAVIGIFIGAFLIDVYEWIIDN